MPELLARHHSRIHAAQSLRVAGRVVSVTGLTVVVEGLPVPVGSLCKIELRRPEEHSECRMSNEERRGQTGEPYPPGGTELQLLRVKQSSSFVPPQSAAHSILGQVVAIHNDRAIVLTLQEPLGIRVGDPVTSTTAMEYVPVGRQMLGSVLDGLGRPISGRREFIVEDHYPVFAVPPAPLGSSPQAIMTPDGNDVLGTTQRPIRRAIDQPLATGIRAIDALHTLGGGQRVGIFSGTGVGKTVLMGMITRKTEADVIVVALIGERGREVGDFVRKELGESGLRRTVLVVSTSDESPVLRVRAAFVATAVAEYFRDLGRDVLLLTDSTTRIAMAQRQIALSAGEPPATRGYPPSVFSLLPKLIERSGRTDRGSITGVYTVLVEGDDINEPVSDCLRGTLDGHIWLSRSLANRGHYPAISIVESISRLMPDVVDADHRESAAEVRRVLAVWADIEDLVNVGAYAPGANVDFDVAVKMKPAIDEFLRQGIHERTEDRTNLQLCPSPADPGAAAAPRAASLAETRERVLRLAGEIRELRQSVSAGRSHRKGNGRKPAPGGTDVTGQPLQPPASVSG